MKFQYCSDLHLEFTENEAYLQNHPLPVMAETLIIAGDTYLFGPGFKNHPYFDWLSEHFKQVYLIPGNHEYYRGYDLSKAYPKMEMELRPNVWMVNNHELILEGVRFLFTTLWGKIERYPSQVVRGLMDFHRMKNDGHDLTVKDFNDAFAKSLKFLEQALQTPTDLPTVVVTHHLPSMACNAPEYMGSILNEGFCVDLNDFILEQDIACWLYGHSHRNIPTFKIGNTVMITNQLGYVHIGESDTFKPGAVMDVGKLVKL